MKETCIYKNEAFIYKNAGCIYKNKSFVYSLLLGFDKFSIRPG